MRVTIAGASGRMGQTLVQMVSDDPRVTLSGAMERAGHAWLGRDVGEAMGGTALGVAVTDSLPPCDAVIDFTAPAATLGLAQDAANAGTAHIIGTTGFAEDELAQLDAMADRLVMVRAGNMSLGVNLLTQLTRQVAAALGPEYDIEIIEAHHNRKVDAPSGTALMLGDAAADGRGVDLAEVSDRGRDGITDARTPGHIGFSAIRGGDIIGEHDVLFAGPGERITLRHVASDRSLFARGALTAALWTAGRTPGAYDMIDVLGLR